MNADSKRLNEISERVIGCAFTVANTLGAGFLEKVYEDALAHELTKAGLMVSQQIAIGIEYGGVTIGAYVADLLVENAVLVDIKAVRALDTSHDAQCLNYLRATGGRRSRFLNGRTHARTHWCWYGPTIISFTT